MPIKPKTFFDSKGHTDDLQRLFCLDEDNVLWVLIVPTTKKEVYNTRMQGVQYTEPEDWFWRRVSLQTENEAAEAAKHGPKEPPLR